MLSQKLKNSITLLPICNHFTGSKSKNAYNTKFSHLLTNHSTTNLPFLIFSPYNQLDLPAPLQLSLFNALPIPLGSKFLTSFYFQAPLLLLFGMLYHTIFVLTLSSQAHSLLSLSSSQFHKQLKTFPSFLSSLAYISLLDWPLGTLIRPVNVIHNSFHILHPRYVHLLNSLWFDVFHSVSK